MSSGSNAQSIGSLVIDLRANVAQLRVDMDEVKNTVQKSSREMSSQMKKDMTETRQVLALMREDFGVGVPRELRKVIASSELARNAILGIKNALFGLAFINIGIEAFNKIKEVFDGIAKAKEEILKQAKAEVDLQHAMELTNKAHEERLRLINLIGKSEEEQFKSNAEHLQEELNAQRAKLYGLKEELGFMQAFKADAATKAFNENVLPLMKGNTSVEQQRAALASMIEEAIKVPIAVRTELNKANDEYLKALDALAAFKANHADKERQDNKKTADEQQKQLEQAISKLNEFRQKVIETEEPLQKNRDEWEKIRQTQALIIAQHPELQMKAVGTFAAQARKEHELILALDKQITAELHQGLAELEKMFHAQGMSPIAGIIGGMQSGAPKLDGSLAGFKQGKIAEFSSTLKDAAASSKFLEQAMEGLLTPMDKFEILQAEIVPLLERYKDYPDVIKAIQREVTLANPEFQKLQQASAEFGHDLANEFDQLITKGESFSDFLKNIAKDIEQIALKALLLKPLENFFSGGSTGTGGFLGLIKGIFGFADGGSPPVGQVSLVGERGPELFVPSTAGTIIPNGSFGGGVTQIFNIDARGAAPGSEIAIMRGIQRALEQNVNRSVAAGIDYQRRR